MNGNALDRLSGISAQINNIKQMITKVASTEVNVFITGESGTGKEIVSRCVHGLSDRKDKPFVPVNCGAIPHELLESELFGHEKGAFTGAISTRKGRFELANGGTIFLDEIGDMPLNMQVKLLRVIQERVFERIGSNQSIRSNVRIIAATHRNLEEEIEKGKFREDLYYRLNVFPIEMPSLRSRKEDIPFIINDLIKRFSQDLNQNITLSSQTLEVLSQYHWKGNVRELSNLIERLFVLYSGSVIEPIHLPKKYQNEQMDNNDIEPNSRSQLAKDFTQTVMVAQNVNQNDCIDLKQVIQDMEKAYILDALEKSNGIVSHAAKRLTIRRTTLVEKIKKYQISKAC